MMKTHLELCQAKRTSGGASRVRVPDELDIMTEVQQDASEKLRKSFRSCRDPETILTMIYKALGFGEGLLAYPEYLMAWSLTGITYSPDFTLTKVSEYLQDKKISAHPTAQLLALPPQLSLVTAQTRPGNLRLNTTCHNETKIAPRFSLQMNQNKRRNAVLWTVSEDYTDERRVMKRRCTAFARREFVTRPLPRSKIVITNATSTTSTKPVLSYPAQPEPPPISTLPFEAFPKALPGHGSHFVEHFSDSDGKWDFRLAGLEDTRSLLKEENSVIYRD